MSYRLMFLRLARHVVTCHLILDRVMQWRVSWLWWKPRHAVSSVRFQFKRREIRKVMDLVTHAPIRQLILLSNSRHIVWFFQWYCKFSHFFIPYCSWNWELNHSSFWWTYEIYIFKTSRTFFGACSEWSATDKLFSYLEVCVREK